MTQAEFEREFHSRTLAYQPAYKSDQRPVVIRLGDDAHSSNGHLLAVALINQLARAHQHIAMPDVDDSPLLCPQLFGFATVHDATIGLALAINPFITATTETRAEPPLVTIGIGNVKAPVDLQVGCEGWLATFGPTARIDPNPTGQLGAMLTSCITATYTLPKPPRQPHPPRHQLLPVGIRPRERPSGTPVRRRPRCRQRPPGWCRWSWRVARLLARPHRP